MAIKTTLAQHQNKAEEINWRVKQIVYSPRSGFVLTNGVHNGIYFTGVALTNDSHEVGVLVDDWFKDNFIRVGAPITITFENE